MAGDSENGNGNGNGRWHLILSMMSAAAIAIGAIVASFVQTAALSTQVGIDASRIVTMEASLVQANERISAIRADLSQTHADLREVETQFCGNDIVRNLMHATDLRMIAMLWHKAFPEMIMPTDNAYYPQICNRANTSTLENGNSTK